MPGRAGCRAATLDAMTRWRRYAWVGVWLLGWPISGASLGSRGVVVAVVVGVLAGVVWQVVDRRDVAERLSVLAVLSLGMGLFLALDGASGASSTRVDPGGATYFVMVASSVVVTERVLRRRALGRVTLDMVHAPEGGGRPDA